MARTRAAPERPVFLDDRITDSTMRCSSSAQYRCRLSRRESTASSLKAAKALTRIWSEQAIVDCGADTGKKSGPYAPRVPHLARRTFSPVDPHRSAGRNQISFRIHDGARRPLLLSEWPAP